jgi:8-oxo-dGTP pyrophosphatase MutT (NUDIX family)
MTTRFTVIPAVHLILTRERRVLLLRRFNTGYEDGRYSLPAGHLDGGEMVTQAAVREAREELAIDIDPADCRVVQVMHRRSTEERVDFFVAVQTWAGEIENGEPDRCDHVAWFDLDRLPDDVIPYIRQALANFRRGVWFDSFGWGGAPAERASA